jgi:SPP1 gp7 family putative phage head morphogenesis protein
MTLRNAFVREMNRRFVLVARTVTKAVAEEDVFGLSQTNTLTVNQNTPGSRAFSFRTKDQKIQAFLQWLRTLEDTVILEMAQSAQYGTWTNVPWFHLYLAKAFDQGTRRADQEMQKAGLGLVIPTLDGQVFLNVVALEKLRVLFTRAFTDLRGITNSMDEQISRILAQGLFEGQSPITLARMINSAIIGGGDTLGLDIKYINKQGNQVSYFMSGKRRAEILARTEIIRAHHIANITEYRKWGLQGVFVLAEWSTAGDDRVCESCGSLQGRIFTLDEIEPLIPLHPQCRCIALPYVDKTKTITGGN